MSQHDVVRAQEEVVERDPKTGEFVERLFTPKDLSAWENGHRRVSDDYLARIGAITGQTFDWFFAEHPDSEV